MICHRIGNVIICRSRSPRARCSVAGCKRPHTRLCDWPEGPGRTCDHKLCDKHATRMRWPQKVPGDSRDLCPSHARQLELELGTEGGAP